MAAALYGSDGFYRNNSPDAHFRTSVTASPLLAESMVELVVAVDAALSKPRRLDIVDVGAGDGSLLVGLMKALPPHVAARAHPVGVEIRPRPAGLDSHVSWTDKPPNAVDGLVIAHEYLDNVSCDVAELGQDGLLHQVLVEPCSGVESVGPPLTAEQAEWVGSWWPLSQPGNRAEVGSSRDSAWADLVGRLHRGLAVAIDYGHCRADRLSGVLPVGTLTGYRAGRQVVPIPDGSCDITAHVAIDACEQAGLAAGADASALISQGAALRALGLDAARPPIDLARSDPHRYVDGLSRASHAAELLDPAALGSFWWLLQAKGCLPGLPGIRWSSGRA